MLQRITTPLFYVNSRPHIGHLYSILYADAIKEWKVLNGQKCELLTGTDEYGQKVLQSAHYNNQSPQLFCDKISNLFRELVSNYQIQPDHFVRTSEDIHKKQVQDCWSKLIQKQFIFKGKYSGWYCQNDEAFVQERDVANSLSSTGHPVEWVEEMNYFISTQRHNDFINNHIDQKGGKYKKELKMDLSQQKDFCVSRPKSRNPWGIQVPDDEHSTIYVWFDALLGYLQQWNTKEELSFYNIYEVQRGSSCVRKRDHQIPLNISSSIIQWPGYKLQPDLYRTPPLDSGRSNNFTVILIQREKCQNLQIMWFVPLSYNKHLITKQFVYYFYPKVHKTLTQNLMSSIQLKSTMTIQVLFVIQIILKTKITLFIGLQIQGFLPNQCQLLSLKIFLYQTEKSFYNSRNKEVFNYKSNQQNIDQIQAKLDDYDFANGYQEIRKCFFLLNKYIDTKAAWSIIDQDQKNRTLSVIIVMIKLLMFNLVPFIPKEILFLEQYIGGPLRNIPQNLTIEVFNKDLKKLHRKKY